MTPWLLCVMLNWKLSTPPECIPYPSFIACEMALADWLVRVFAWEERSGIVKSRALAMCEPQELGV